MTGISRNQKLTAYRIRRLAVRTFPGYFAWCLHIEPLCICRCCHISGAFYRLIQIGADLIHTDNKYNLFRPLCNTRNTVRISINIYHNSVIGHCIGTRKKNIGIISCHQAFTRCHIGTVNIVVVAFFQRLNQSDFMCALTTAHCYSASFSNYFQGLFHCFFFVRSIITCHISGL